MTLTHSFLRFLACQKTELWDDNFWYCCEHTWVAIITEHPGLYDEMSDYTKTAGDWSEKLNFYTSWQVHLFPYLYTFSHIWDIQIIKKTLNNYLLFYWGKNSVYKDKFDISLCRKTDYKPAPYILYTCTLATYIQYTQCNPASAYAMLAMHARSYSCAPDRRVSQSRIACFRDTSRIWSGTECELNRELNVLFLCPFATTTASIRATKRLTIHHFVYNETQCIARVIHAIVQSSQVGVVRENVTITHKSLRISWIWPLPALADDAENREFDVSLF